MLRRFWTMFAVCLALFAGACFGQGNGKSSANSAPVKKSAEDQDTSVEAQFLKLTEEVLYAEVTGDVAAMDRLFTDDYVHTHSSGWVENKTEFLSLYKNGKRKYNAADISQVKVHFYGASAVVNGREHINELNGDHQYLFLCVWVEQKGTWRLAAWVANPVPKTAGAPDNFK